MIDIEKYTQDEVYKNLIAVEGHLEKFSQAPLFCRACLRKHAAYIEILCEECEPAECKLNPLYKEIRTYALELKTNLPSLDKEKVKRFLEQNRHFRKQIEIEEETGHLKREV